MISWFAGRRASVPRCCRWDLRTSDVTVVQQEETDSYRPGWNGDTFTRDLHEDLYIKVGRDLPPTHTTFYVHGSHEVLLPSFPFLPSRIFGSATPLEGSPWFSAHENGSNGWWLSHRMSWGSRLRLVSAAAAVHLFCSVGCLCVCPYVADDVVSTPTTISRGGVRASSVVWFCQMKFGTTTQHERERKNILLISDRKFLLATSSSS